MIALSKTAAFAEEDEEEAAGGEEEREGEAAMDAEEAALVQQAADAETAEQVGAHARARQGVALQLSWVFLFVWQVSRL